MKAQLLDMVMTVGITGLFLWLRQAFLSIGRKRETEASRSNLSLMRPDSLESGDGPNQSEDDTSPVQVEEFVAELRAKAKGQAVGSLRQNGHLSRP